MVLVLGHGGADAFVRRLGKQVDEQALPGVQAFPFLQSGEAILQDILHMEGPEGRRNKHPVVEQSQQRLDHPWQLQPGGVIPAQCPVSPFGPAIGAGFEPFQIEGEWRFHR